VDFAGFGEAVFFAPLLCPIASTGSRTINRNNFVFERVVMFF
jgi:hypothetical protein